MAVLPDEKKSDSLNDHQVGEAIMLSEAQEQHLKNGTSDDEEDVKCPSHTTERRLLTKIDLHVVPFLCVMYLLAFLGKATSLLPIWHLKQFRAMPTSFLRRLTNFFFTDRVNIANAKIFDLQKDLGMTKPSQFNTAIVIFFVPYVLFEIPSNILLKKFKPSTWLSLNMFLFGLTTMLQGLVQNYAGLLTTRFFLGLFETGMFPGGKSSNVASGTHAL